MRTICLSAFFLFSLVSYGQNPVDSLEIKKYVDSINVLLDKWTGHDPVLSVETSGNSRILHKDGSRFIFNMRELKGENERENGLFHGVNLKVYDPRTRPAEQHFIYFRGTGSDGLIRFGHIPEPELWEIYRLCVKLRELFL